MAAEPLQPMAFEKFDPRKPFKAALNFDDRPTDEKGFSRVFRILFSPLLKEKKTFRERLVTEEVFALSDQPPWVHIPVMSP